MSDKKSKLLRQLSRVTNIPYKKLKKIEISPANIKEMLEAKECEESSHVD